MMTFVTRVLDSCAHGVIPGHSSIRALAGHADLLQSRGVSA